MVYPTLPAAKEFRFASLTNFFCTTHQAREPLPTLTHVVLADELRLGACFLPLQKLRDGRKTSLDPLGLPIVYAVSRGPLHEAHEPALQLLVAIFVAILDCPHDGPGKRMRVLPITRIGNRDHPLISIQQTPAG